MPTPSYRVEKVDVILRPNIKDPLNLEGTYDEDQSNLLNKRTNNSGGVSGSGSGGTTTYKHRRSLSRNEDGNNVNSDDDDSTTVKANNVKETAGSGSGGGGGGGGQTPQKPNHLSLNKRRRTTSHSLSTTNTGLTPVTDTNNKAVSASSHDLYSSASVSFIDKTPTIDKNISLVEMNTTVSSVNNSASTPTVCMDIVSTTPTKKPKPLHTTPSKSGAGSDVKYIKNGFKFKHGNYNRYYGYRNLNDDEDHRLAHLKSEWFKDKCVLDIGCNVGHVTLHIARHFEPKKIVGIDIDAQLIFSARKNIRHYINKIENEQNKYPISFQMTYGSLMSEKSLFFPNNICFMQQDYVPDSESSLCSVRSEHDFILALSITKWIHLNNGDDGIKRFFKKVFLNLNPGGSFLLEPQSWNSYKKKAKLTVSYRLCTFSFL